MIIGEYLELVSAQTVTGQQLQEWFPDKDIDVVFLQRQDGSKKEVSFDGPLFREYANVIGIRTKGLTQ